MRIKPYNIECCHYCTKRTGECHATCKEYEDEKAEVDRKNSIIYEAKQKEQAITDVRIAGNHRTKTRKSHTTFRG